MSLRVYAIASSMIIWAKYNNPNAIQCTTSTWASTYIECERWNSMRRIQFVSFSCAFHLQPRQKWHCKCNICLISFCCLCAFAMCVCDSVEWYRRKWGLAAMLVRSDVSHLRGVRNYQPSTLIGIRMSCWTILRATKIKYISEARKRVQQCHVLHGRTVQFAMYVCVYIHPPAVPCTLYVHSKIPYSTEIDYIVRVRGRAKGDGT